MGLFDALRGRGREEPADQAGGEPAAGPVDFRPRTGSTYTSDSGSLTFGTRTVSETAPDGQVRTGEFTSAGRFLLTAVLETSVAITVTDTGSDNGAAAFRARRTDIGTREVVSVEYSLRD